MKIGLIITWLIIATTNAFAAATTNYDFSATSKSGHTLYYTITSDTEPYTVAVVRKYKSLSLLANYEGSLIIPETVTYNSIDYTVTYIDQEAFYGEDKITSLTVPSTIQGVGYRAFSKILGISESNTGTISSNNSSKFKKYDNAYYLGNSENPYVILVRATSTSIKSCEISEGCKAVYDNAFIDCGSLTYNEYEGVQYLGTSSNPYFFLVSVKRNTNGQVQGPFSGEIHKDCKIIGGNVGGIRPGNGGLSRTCVKSIPEGVVSICCDALGNCYFFGLLTIPTSVTNLNGWAVAWRLNDVYVDGVKIGAQKVLVPKTVTSAGLCTFSGTDAYCEAESKPKNWTGDCGGNLIFGCRVIRSNVNDTVQGKVLLEGDNYAEKGGDGSLWYLKETTDGTATLTAVAKEGYHFVRWEDDETAGSNRTVNVSASKTYTAVFEPGEATAVSQNKQSHLSISSSGRNIIIESATTYIEVYDATGRRIAHEAPAKQNIITVGNNGVYIVKSGGEVRKVVVK